jgi:hypothetical protein
VGLLYESRASMGEDIEFSRSAVVRFLNTLTEAAGIYDARGV